MAWAFDFGKWKTDRIPLSGLGFSIRTMEKEMETTITTYRGVT